jgi:hypothetical protein
VQFSQTWAALLTYFALLASTALAQPASPTTNVLTRITMVESEHGRATIFSLDVDHREYWITAKHVVTGAEHPPYGSITSRSAALRILNPGAVGEQWLSVNFSVLDPGKDIDIVVLASPKLLLDNPLPSLATGSENLPLGGDCEFLGFPYGGGWRANFAGGQSFWMPFVKHCTVSAMATMEPRIWVLDGINNAGFSGGPVIIKTGLEQKIIAVVSSYLTEPTDVIPSAAGKLAPIKTSANDKKTAEHTGGKINLNSGFIIAYDIKYIFDAINKSPIGPLRESK